MLPRNFVPHFLSFYPVYITKVNDVDLLFVIIKTSDAIIDRPLDLRYTIFTTVLVHSSAPYMLIQYVLPWHLF